MKKVTVALSLLITAIGILVASSVQACGVFSLCYLGDRTYRVRMPTDHNGKDLVGAIVFAHGLGGTAQGVVNSSYFGRMADELGIAIIAGKAASRAWALPGSPSVIPREGVDELAYFDAVIEDATRRFPIDRNRLMATGFSAGGMMVWTLACHRSQSFAAFVPMAGTFWRPIPDKCTTPPASIVHIHGDRDKTVPLKGRKVRDAIQGDVHKVLEMYSRFGGYGGAEKEKINRLSCEHRTNSTGEFLSFCLFPDGHSFRTDYVKTAWRLFERAGKL